MLRQSRGIEWTSEELWGAKQRRFHCDAFYSIADRFPKQKQSSALAFLLFWNSFVAPACANPTRSTSGVCQVIGFSGEEVAHHTFYPAGGQGERIQGCKKKNGSRADNDGWYSQSNRWQFVDSAQVALNNDRVCKLDSCRLSN